MIMVIMQTKLTSVRYFNIYAPSSHRWDIGQIYNDPDCATSIKVRAGRHIQLWKHYYSLFLLVSFWQCRFWQCHRLKHSVQWSVPLVFSVPTRLGPEDRIYQGFKINSSKVRQVKKLHLKLPSSVIGRHTNGCRESGHFLWDFVAGKW